MSSYLKRVALMTEQKRTKGEHLNSKNKMLLFGESGKSTICMSYSMTQKRPVYVITPAGGSHMLQTYFPNTYVESLNGLSHLLDIVKSLEEEYRGVIDLRTVIVNNEKERIQKAEKYYRNFQFDGGLDDKGKPITTIDIWDRMYDAAINQELPFSAIVIEEVNIINAWVYNAVAEELNMSTVVGEDKGKRGFDWNILEKRILDLFTRILKLPCSVFLCTADRVAKEQQDSNQVIPDLCTGKANRKLQQMIGNVFYVYKEDKTGKHKIQLVETKNVFAKDKIIPPFSSKKLDENLDLTGRPQYFWEYIKEKGKMNNTDSLKVKKETKAF